MYHNESSCTLLLQNISRDLSQKTEDSIKFGYEDFFKIVQKTNGRVSCNSNDTTGEKLLLSYRLDRIDFFSMINEETLISFFRQ